MNIINQFIQQAPEYPELQCACGAFCIKYWQWHSGAEDFRIINQRNAILDVYQRIKFGSFAEKFNLNPHYSNPFLISKEISDSCLYYDAQNEQFSSMVKPMSEQFPDIKISERKLDIGIGKYAILIVSNHYILIYRSNQNEYYYHNPVKQFPLLLKNGIPMLGNLIDENIYTGAGIILP